ncbi:MAG: hypothetical protein VW683_00430 [Betaproteobacteria bacterium]|jgi:hypothetical protein
MSEPKKQVVVYVGRFQPFHKGHYSVYKSLVDRFGADNVFIGTSDKTDPVKSPMTFDEKHDFITKMFPDIPTDQVRHVKNPYNPQEILSDLPDDTVFITAVSQKDSGRLGGKYYSNYDDTEDHSGHKDKGYFVVAPEFQMDVGGKNISGTTIRNAFRNPDVPEREKIELFKKLYGEFNKDQYRKLTRVFSRANPEPVAPEPPMDGDPVGPDKERKPDDDITDPSQGVDPNATVRNPLTKRDILVKTALKYPQDHPAFMAARQMFKEGNISDIFDSIMLENELIKSWNETITTSMLGEKRQSCLIQPWDMYEDVVKKVREARKHGIRHYGLTHALHINRLPNESEESQKITPKKQETDESEVLNDEFVSEAMSSTERVRKYYRNNPEKVKAYLKKTVKDRVARNRDRKKMEKKHGKAKMKNHDVHHPNGPQNGGARLVKKDHGRDKKNEEYVSFVMEGGAAGHMMHPYEDRDLTFGQYKDIIQRGLVGSFDEDPTEKLDGQNIAFTVKDGEVRFARNKGHVKSRGETSLTAAELAEKFEGRGGLSRAFAETAMDLQKAISQMSEDDLREMFGEGRSFMSTEIILPDSQNVIPYGKSVLVFHGSLTYDEGGNLESFEPNDGKVFSDTVQRVGAERQQTFGLRGPKTITFSDEEFDRMQEATDSFHAEVDSLRDSVGADDDTPVREYYEQWWSNKIDQYTQSMGISLSPEERQGLIQRWGFGDKSFRLAKLQDPSAREWAKDFEKTELKTLTKEARRPFEDLFLKVGAMALKRSGDLLTANIPAATEEIKRELAKVMTSVMATQPGDQAEKLQYEFERLQKIGFDNIAPTEGSVFMYNGQPYKFTGTFAPINQILGAFKFGGGEEMERQADAGDESPSQQPSGKEEPDSRSQFITQFYGDQIKNPETDNMITIKTALGYDRNHPARQAAIQYLASKM